MKETTKHRDAFNLYYEMGAGRTLENLAAQLSSMDRQVTIRTLYEWSRQLHWQNRLADIEREARVAEDQARIQAIREMQERHAKEALLLQQTGMEWLTSIPEGRLTPDAAIRALVEGARLERLARGEATERTEIGPIKNNPLEEISDDELRELVEIAQSNLGRNVEKES